jgi:hypothetical protein
MRKQIHYDLLELEDRNRLRNIIEMLPAEPSFLSTLEKLSSFVDVCCPRLRASRSRACGLAVLNGCIAVRTEYLSGVLGKCRSWLNAKFKDAGYSLISPDCTVHRQFNDVLQYPIDSDEHRHWNFRELPVTFDDWSSFVFDDEDE